MDQLKQTVQSIRNQKGLKGWLKRKLLGSALVALDAAEQDDSRLLKVAARNKAEIDKQAVALEEMQQTIQKALEKQAEQLAGLAEQAVGLRRDLETVSINLRNNNAQLQDHKSQLDYLKVQQRQMARQQAAAPAQTAPAQAAEIAAAPVQAKAGEQTYDTIEYFDFENHFRGSIEHIKEAQRLYLPYFAGKRHVLDFGCGRGEFLSLMQEQGIPAEGVDLYAPYAEYCTMQGLKATCGDGLSYLAKMEQVDGIFAGQVVEHLTPEQILALCRMAYEKLEPGGCFVAETPNPLSLSIYTNAFYIDPSHVKPVHPLTMQYYLEKAGFSEMQVLYPESSRPERRIPELRCAGENVAEFNEAMQQVAQMLYGSQDYAIVAVKGLQ